MSSTITNISDTTRAKIKAKLPISMPNNPSNYGYSADQIKKLLSSRAILDSDYSVLAEIDRVIDEANTLFANAPLYYSDYGYYLATHPFHIESSLYVQGNVQFDSTVDLKSDVQLTGSETITTLPDYIAVATGDYNVIKLITPSAFKTAMDMASATTVANIIAGTQSIKALISGGAINGTTFYGNKLMANAISTYNYMESGTIGSIDSSSGYVAYTDSNGYLLRTPISTFISNLDIASASSLIEISNELNSYKEQHTAEYTTLYNKVANFLDTTDTTLDQLSEVIAYINTKEGATEFAEALALKLDKSEITNYYTKAQVENYIATTLVNYPKKTDVSDIVKAEADTIEESDIDIGTSTDYDTTSDTQVPTTKAVQTMIEAKATDYVSETELTEKGYQTEANVKTTIEGYGYQTETQVTALIESYLSTASASSEDEEV